MKTPATAKKGKTGGPGVPRPLARRLSDKQLADAIKQFAGMTCVMARHLGVCNSTVWRRINSSPELIALIEEERELALDRTELSMFKAISNGDSGLIRFYLTTHGRGRGYVLSERVEHQFLGEDGAPAAMLPPIINVTVSNPETQKAASADA